jgi:hypothetical protein
MEVRPDIIEELELTPKWLCVGILILIVPMCLIDGYHLITHFREMATLNKINDVLVLLVSPAVFWVCLSDLKSHNESH